MEFSEVDRLGVEIRFLTLTSSCITTVWLLTETEAYHPGLLGALNVGFMERLSTNATALMESAIYLLCLRYYVIKSMAICLYLFTRPVETHKLLGSANTKLEDTDVMIENIKVAHIDPTQRIWFVRSVSGMYAEHFKVGGLIATGHLSEIFGDGLRELPTLDDVRNKILSNDEYSTFHFNEKDKKNTKIFNGKGSKLYNAINKFGNEISAGDLVITKTASDGFMIGVCGSNEPYFSSEPVKLAKSETAEEDGSLRLEFTFRKKVVWGPTIHKKDVPEALQNSLARNTITELTTHKEMIYHLLYPFFTDGESLYFSNKIRTTGDINSAVIGKLFQNISLVGPLIAAILAGTSIDAESIIRLAEQSIFSDVILSTSKADFASPGDTWSKISLADFTSAIEALPKQVVALAFGCLLITGTYAFESASIDQEVSATAHESLVITQEKATPFNDKFKGAEPSQPISDIEEAIKRQRLGIEELKEKAYVGAIRDSLQLEIISPKTSNLESFEYGIKVYKLGDK